MPGKAAQNWLPDFFLLESSYGTGTLGPMLGRYIDPLGEPRLRSARRASETRLLSFGAHPPLCAAGKSVPSLCAEAGKRVM